ncbi:hypothetical protein ACHAWU_004560 [Discostella pseudostelligera]|uniref:Uncharacterized protein n=1 Tax=Discostella pseudostelligera TaxID=259834 RepID=A0ABD3MXT9_9STRA
MWSKKHANIDIEAQPSSDGGRRGTAVDILKNDVIAVVTDASPSSPIQSSGRPIPDTDEGVVSSSSSNDDKQINIMNASIVPYENHEIDTTTTTPVKSSTENNSPPVIEDDEGVWVGIGCGEAFTLNTTACSESPLESYLGKHSNHHRRSHHHTTTIPKAIDFQKFESDNLPRVDEDRISNIGSDLLQKKPFAGERIIGSESVAELSTDLSIMEHSIASVVTKEGCIDLAKRFEKMEHILMERAGETSRSDALRALAQATQKQSKRADLLKKKLNKQEKKNDELNHLCQRLMEELTESKRAQSDMKVQMNELTRKSAGQRTELHRYKSQNKELKSKLDEMAMKVRKLEEENNKKSRLLLHSNSEKKSSTQLQKELDELRLESSRRANTDKATIEQLESEIAQMRANHATKENRSERKIQILMEIRSALEQQITLLEGHDES